MSEYNICSRCVMDTSVANISFDASGECSFCAIHKDMDRNAPLDDSSADRLSSFLKTVKATGQGKTYDAVIGVSGGTDSSYALLLAKRHGLRPLAVHYDNGWNSEIAVRNIHTICDSLQIDLHTEVADWDTFKDLQIAFLKASVPDVEMPTDLGIFGTLYKVAASHGIHYILSGASFRTEGKIPLAWGYGDGRYVKAIHDRYGQTSLRDFPNPTLLSLIKRLFINRIKVVRFLEYFPYSKSQAQEVLRQELGWKDYGGHHYESIFTRYYQSYLSPAKFGMDRRRVTFSAAIREGAMSRKDALDQLKQPPYPLDKIAEDEAYIIKKLDLSEKQFREIIAKPVRHFLHYPSYYPLFRMLRKPLRLAYKLKLTPTMFYEDITLADIERHARHCNPCDIFSKSKNVRN